MLFNLDHPLEAMFYTPYVAYRKPPTVAQARLLRGAGWRVVVLDRGDLPAELRAEPGSSGCRAPCRSGTTSPRTSCRCRGPDRPAGILRGAALFAAVGSLPYPYEVMTMNRTLSSLSRRSSILMLALFVSLMIFGCREGDTAAGSGGSGGNGAGTVGSKPEFRLKSLDGRALGPRDFPGQVVLVDFWATWCGPCQIQSQILESLHGDLKGKGVQFLAANVGEDEATVKGFLKKKPFSYPVLLDPEDTVSSNLGVYALPTLMIVDKKGKISYIQPGIADAPTLRRALKEAGAGV